MASAPKTTDMGALGSVDHFANIKSEISVGMVGRQYRVVKSHVINGTGYEAPIDGRLFDSVYEARAAARIIRTSQVSA